MRWAFVMCLAGALVLVAPAFAQESPVEAPPPSPEETAPAAPDREADHKAQAEQRFYKGLQLYREQLWDAALAEFLESRALHPTRAATRNAGLALRKLGRFDEAIKMLDGALGEFPDMSEDERATTERELSELRALIGTLDLRLSDPGAVVLVDGRERGVSPLPPLVVVAGSHQVTVYREGFVPYSGMVEVAGGKVLVLSLTLRPLGVSGRLGVAEQGGAPAEVLVDGVVVGRTPWEGPLAVGTHHVALRGVGMTGSQPAAVTVRQGEVTRLNLVLALLDSELVLQPSPRDAAVAIDGVALGNGGWRGRLRAGNHKLEVAARGYVPIVRQVMLPPGRLTTLAIELERDRTSPEWQAKNQPRIVLEAAVGPALALGLGGEVGGGCGGGCSSGPAAGVLAMIRGGYQLGIGLGLLVEGGYFQAGQSIDRSAVLKERPDALRVVGGTTRDDLLLRGALVGGAIAYSAGSDFTWTVRVGAGGLIGAIRDRRAGTFMDASATYQAAPVEEEHAARLLYVSPEARLGWRFTKQSEISLGVQGMLLVPLEEARWLNERDVTTSSFFGFYEEETLLGASFFVVPSAGGRIDF